MTNTDLAIKHYGVEQAAEVRPVLLEVYADVYADRQDDPFFAVDRFAEGLDGWSGRPDWSCVIGWVGLEAVGYAYGAPLPKDAAWWGGLLTERPKHDIAETGTRTFAISELMVRSQWRKKGISRALHDALLHGRPEERATLLVEKDHPKVRTLYQSWGWQWFGDLQPRLPQAPLLDSLVLDLRRE
jgi:GNAT superfamily N-acetyltransferase